MTGANAPTFHRSLRILTGTLMGAPVLVLVACAAILQDGLTDPPPWMLAVVAGDGAFTFLLLQTVGLRSVPAIAPGTPEESARATSAAALQTNLILRFAITEAVALVAIALAFSAESGGTVVLLLGVVLSVALMLIYVWPGDRVISTIQGALEREGGVSSLRAALDGPPPASRA